MPETEEKGTAEEQVPDEAENGLKAVVERTAPCECVISISAEADFLRNRYQEELATLQAEVSLPGFRRGKAPVGLVEKKMGTALKNDLITGVVSEAYENAVEKHDLSVVSSVDGPDPDSIDWEPGQPFEFEIKCEVLPEVEVTPEGYKGLKIQVPAYEVTDEIFAAEMERFATRFTTYEPVSDGGIDWDDYVEGTVTLADGDFSERFGFHPRAEKMGPFAVEGIRTVLAEAKAGDEVELDAVVSEADLGQRDELKDLAGRSVKLRLAIGTVMRRNVPELNDELAGKLGMNSVADIEGMVREQLADAASRRTEDARREAVFNALLANFPCEMPDSLVERATREEQMRRLVRLLRAGVPRAEAEKAATEGRFQTREAVARRLAVTYVLRKVADEERILVTESEVDAQIRVFANNQGWREDRARGYMEERGLVRNLRDDMREEATVEFLIKNGTVEEISPEQFAAQTPAAAESGAAEQPAEAEQ